MSELNLGPPEACARLGFESQDRRTGPKSRYYTVAPIAEIRAENYQTQ
jgi:hypothetical protein